MKNILAAPRVEDFEVDGQICAELKAELKDEWTGGCLSTSRWFVDTYPGKYH
jgi:hypothetical protein